MAKIIFYEYNNKTYKLEYYPKDIKNINIRLVNDIFKISYPNNLDYNYLMKKFYKAVPSLVNRQKFLFSNYSSEKGVYILGNFEEFHDGNFIKVLNHDILFINENHFYKIIKPFFLEYITNRVRKIENIMTPGVIHDIDVKNVTSYFGKNFIRKKLLIFNSCMIHYREEIIDALIVHELAHDYVHGHNKKFYQKCVEYCPNYFKLDKMLMEHCL